MPEPRLGPNLVGGGHDVFVGRAARRIDDNDNDGNDGNDGNDNDNDAGSHGGRRRRRGFVD